MHSTSTIGTLKQKPGVPALKIPPASTEPGQNGLISPINRNAETGKVSSPMVGINRKKADRSDSDR